MCTQDPASLWAEDEDGCIPLQFAILKEQEECVRLLLASIPLAAERTRLVNHPNKRGWTSLHYAVCAQALASSPRAAPAASSPMPLPAALAGGGLQQPEQDGHAPVLAVRWSGSLGPGRAGQDTRPVGL